jgi:hypothetical protein
MSDPLAQRLNGVGFAFVPGARMRSLLDGHRPLMDWNRFADSWDDLVVDNYMADQGRYRKRRHAVYSVKADGAIERLPAQPHVQSLEYNPLNGGIERWFEPIRPEVATSVSFTAIVELGLALFGILSPRSAWHIEAHQFRIEARSDAAGLPTPEGVHRDGVDYVIVMLVERVNIASGTTTMHALDGKLLGSFTLAEPFDAALLDDRRVMHGVTPVQPVDPSRPAWRDVLVVTYRRA